MQHEDFWQLIQSVRGELKSSRPMSVILADRLRSMSPQDIIDYESIFFEYFFQANTYDLWTAAIIIEGGCGDDGFMDFRAGLIGLGKEVYQAAVRDPDTLAEIEIGEERMVSDEDMLYVASNAYRAVTGESLPHGPSRPEVPPTGIDDTSPDAVQQRFPRLVARYGYS